MRSSAWVARFNYNNSTEDFYSQNNLWPRPYFLILLRLFGTLSFDICQFWLFFFHCHWCHCLARVYWDNQIFVFLQGEAAPWHNKKSPSMWRKTSVKQSRQKSTFHQLIHGFLQKNPRCKDGTFRGEAVELHRGYRPRGDDRMVPWCCQHRLTWHTGRSSLPTWQQTTTNTADVQNIQNIQKMLSEIEWQDVTAKTCRSIPPMTCSRGAMLRSKLDFDLQGYRVRGKQTNKGFLWQDSDQGLSLQHPLNFCSEPSLEILKAIEQESWDSGQDIRQHLTHCSPLDFLDCD